MSSVLRSVRKRKKGCTLGAVDVIDREGYAELEVDAKVELIRSLVPLGLLHIEELLDRHDDVEEESRVSHQEPRRVSTRNGLDSERSRERANVRAAYEELGKAIKSETQRRSAWQTLLDRLGTAFFAVMLWTLVQYLLERLN